VNETGIAAFVASMVRTRPGQVAVATLLAMILAGILALAGIASPWVDLPLMAACLLVGVPLVVRVVHDAWHRSFGTDVLGLLALIVGAVMGEWLVASVIALMLAGGEALERTASVRAARVLEALARRNPTLAHRRDVHGVLSEIPVDDVRVDDILVLLPHDLCPVDGEVVEGQGTMDESYLTGEPYVISKGPGSSVLSGAINGDQLLVIRAQHEARDSRYARIVGILEKAEAERPPMRRLADRLGGAYTLIALAVASLGWIISGDPDRFLAVLVIATPCPLLIGVPVAIVGAISLAARNGIIVKDPSALERIPTVRTMIFDKTGTLTYGRPTVTEVEVLTSAPPGVDASRALALAAALERFSRHPLAPAVLQAAHDLPDLPVTRMAEHPGQGLRGEADGHEVAVLGRTQVQTELPEAQAGLECVLVVDDRPAALIRFRDTPRAGARGFVGHLGGSHQVTRTLMLSGDRPSEVEYLGSLVGLDEMRGSVSPEEKLRIVREETARAPTAFFGDGINDAPAMTAATVGVAFGQGSDITAEAASAVVLDSSLERLDELLHIARRMRRIALQTAIGGIVLSVIGMALAVVGLLPPIAGAIGQEAIDVLAIANALRVGLHRRPLRDLPPAQTMGTESQGDRL
jgi:heavy metal translocating P-type ATPase